MGLFEKDQLLRLLEQMTEMITAIRTAIEGGKSREALASIADAQRHVTGPLGGGLDRLDAGSVVSLLGAKKAGIHAELLRLEAEARDALGEAVKARGLEARAAAIARAIG